MKKTPLLFTLFLYFIPLICYGQHDINAEEDSKNQSSEIDKFLSDSARIEFLLATEMPLRDKFTEIDSILMFYSDTRFLAKYYHKGLALATQKEEYYWKSHFQNFLGIIYHDYLQKTDSAGYYWNLALISAKKSEDSESIARIHGLLRYYYTITSEVDKALAHCYAAMDIYEEMSDSVGIGATWNDLAGVFLKAERYEEVLECTEKAISFLTGQENWFELSNTLIKKAEAHNELGDSIQAIRAYDQGIRAGKKMTMTGHEIVLHSFYLSIATFYTNRADFKKARDYLDNAYETTNHPSTDESYWSYWYFQSGMLFLEQQKFVKAIEDLEKFCTLEGAEGIAYLPLAESYAGLNDFENAYTFQVKHQIYSDSIQEQESVQKMNRLKTEFETEKKDETIAVQEATIAQSQKIQYLSFGIAALLAAFLAGLFYFFNKNKKKNVLLSKQNALIEKKNAQNELLLKEIHHRVKNNLETVSSLLALQSATIEDPTVLDAMLESQNRVQSMGMIHQKLYQGENLASIEMKDYFLNLSEGILDSFGAEGRVQIECAMQKLELDVDTAVPIGLIVNELLTNSLKYAFPDGQNGKISISLKEKNADNLELTISDNGIGKNTISAQKSKGFGTQLIQLLTTQINGKLEEIVNQGTMVSLTFKRTNLA